MQLDRDEFDIKYDSSKVSVEQLIAAAKKAGYTSRVVESSIRVGENSTGKPAPKGFAVLDKALAKAKKDHKLVVVVFSAEWCVPCKKFARETLADERVVELLDR